MGWLLASEPTDVIAVGTLLRVACSGIGQGFLTTHACRGLPYPSHVLGGYCKRALLIPCNFVKSSKQVKADCRPIMQCMMTSSLCSAPGSIRRRNSLVPHLHTYAPGLPVRVARLRHAKQQPAAAAPRQPATAAAATATTGMAVQDAEQHQQPKQPQQEEFNWYKQWYPVAVLEDLDPTVPSLVHLLGQDLVVWNDRSINQWRAFQDCCPHRLAPLSEGRIDELTGHLYCNYHGWQFDGTGHCSNIPQLAPSQSINAKRSCAISYPTRHSEGLLWVWPDASPTALQDSQAEGAFRGIAPELDAYGDRAHHPLQPKHRWYCRDLSVSWLAAKENAYNDCSHDRVLHHKAISMIDRKHAGYMQIKLTEFGPTGYRVREQNGMFWDTTHFPCGSRRDSNTFFIGVAYVVPTGIGTCRQFHTSLDPALRVMPPPPTSFNSTNSSSNDARHGAANAAAASTASSSSGNGASTVTSSNFVPTSNSATAPKSNSSSSRLAPKPGLWKSLVTSITPLRPRWFLHLEAHLLIDADAAIQSKVDINRAQNDRVYMPAAADSGPAAFMRWLKEYGGGGPPVAKLKDPFVGQGPAVPKDRQLLLDRYGQHTKICRSCNDAYRRFSIAKQVAASVAVMAGAAAIAAVVLLAVGWGPVAATAGVDAATTVASASGGSAVMVGLGVAAGLAASVYAGLSRVLQLFVFLDYDKHHVSKK